MITGTLKLDRNAAKEAFAEFLCCGTLTANQIRFIDQITEHLVRNGVMDLAAVYGYALFKETDGVLPKQAEEVIAIIKEMNKNTRVA